jgi:hypothetical protein
MKTKCLKKLGHSSTDGNLLLSTCLILADDSSGVTCIFALRIS